MGKKNEQILSKEDINFIKVIFKFIQSVGQNNLIITYFQDEDYSNLNDVDLNSQEYFTDTNIKIPEKLYPILNKIYNSVDIEPEHEYDYSQVSFGFNVSKKYIYAKYFYTYPLTEPSENFVEMPEEIHDSIISNCNSNDMKKIMRVEYDGGGDSGFVEGRFVNGCEVPSDVEDFCYELLQSNFGGWEINEGSFGTFWFRMEDKQIKWIHNNRYQDEQHETFFTQIIE